MREGSINQQVGSKSHARKKKIKTCYYRPLILNLKVKIKDMLVSDQIQPNSKDLFRRSRENYSPNGAPTEIIFKASYFSTSN